MAASEFVFKPDLCIQEDSVLPGVDSSRSEIRSLEPPSWIYFSLFLVSGMLALLHQIVWEPVLFTIYGVNIEWVTMIVTVFLWGLGLGSLAGGKLSTRAGLPRLRTCGAIEACIGIFGFVSLGIFHRSALHTAGASLLAAGTATFGLLLPPTLLMGSTLAVLAAYLARQTNNVGRSAGALYCDVQQGWYL